ncbi:MAG TPA: delta-60 repeat domain-containing protein [Flavobacteriales bacterium]|nr:delta-60 repeat domain-containing protein [Flavobacteriales bacterium]
MHRSLPAAILLLLAGQPCLAQLGTLDPGFNGTGYNFTGQAIGSNVTRAVHQAADGNIHMLVASGGILEIRRVLPDGQVDPVWFAFTNTVASVGQPFGDFLELPDGRLLVATEGGAHAIRLLRYTAGGVADATFGTNGVMLHELPDNITQVTVRRMLRQPDGKVVVAGALQGTPHRIFAARYLADGTPDASFNGTGLWTMEVGEGSLVADMVLMPDGDLVLAGHVELGSAAPMQLVRLQANGAVDATFGTTGVATHDLGYGGHRISGIALTPTGGLIGAGRVVESATDGDPLLVLFTAQGALDPTFDGDGWLVLDTDDDADQFLDVLVDGGGHLVATGIASPNGEQELMLTRRTLTGAGDPAFGTNGTTVTDFPYYGVGTCLALQDDGKILVGGWIHTSFYNYGLIARFTGPATGINGPVVEAPHFLVDQVAGLCTVRTSSILERIEVYDLEGRLIHTSMPASTTESE